MAIVLNRRGLVVTRTAVFRVDAGPGIGMGHFMRCRTLALELISQNWVVFFVGNGLPASMMSRPRSVVSPGINHVEFASHTDTAAEVKLLRELITVTFGRHVDCLVIDTYRYSREDFAFLQRFNPARIPVVVIDDLADRDTPAQMVINPNPLFSPEPYQRQGIHHVLCGERYTLIRPEVVACRERVYCKEGPILITLGGGDVVAHLMKILQAFPEEINNQICVSVSDNCPREQIEKWISQCPDRRFINTDTLKFPELLASSSVAITAGGTTLWEVYCLGIPSMSLVWVDNQKQTTVIVKEQATSFLIDIVSNINLELKSDWLDTGLKTLVSKFGVPSQTRVKQEEEFRTNDVITREKTSVIADNCEVINAEFIARTLAQLTADNDFTREMIARQRRLIDGAGARRCVEEINSLSWQEVPLLAADYRRTYENRTL